MLDLMRRHAKSWIIKVALFGIIIVFALFFGWSGPSDTNRNVVAGVNDEDISYDEYEIEMTRRREALRRQLGRNFTPEVLKGLDLKKKVLDGLVAQTLFRQESERLGFFVSDVDLRQDIANDRNFQVNGVFNSRRYEDELRNMRLSSLGYEALRRKELLGIQFTDLVVDSVKTDPRELRRFWHFQNDKLASLTCWSSRTRTSSKNRPTRPSCRHILTRISSNMRSRNR